MKKNVNLGEHNIKMKGNDKGHQYDGAVVGSRWERRGKEKREEGYREWGIGGGHEKISVGIEAVML